MGGSEEDVFDGTIIPAGTLLYNGQNVDLDSLPTARILMNVLYLTSANDYLNYTGSENQRYE